MTKNILIFSDGTGQAGGFMPDEARSNVYKLYRAARVCPDTRIKPDEQVAFYDAGLGSRGDFNGPKHGLWRRIYNTLSQGTGLGITRNIIDCYAAIIELWQPGDRIYLFGFSRGAYTVRCVAGVLSHCGVPTRMKDGSSLKRDPKSAHAIATEAVKKVYQLGSSIPGDPLKNQRLERAFKFRSDYQSGNTASSNVAPYLIGVWDTVSALGAGFFGLLLMAVTYLALVALLAAALTLVGFEIGFLRSFRVPFFALLLTFAAVIPMLWYLKASWEIRQPASLNKYKMAFYDTHLAPGVVFARHALSIDENRRDFARVHWSEEVENNPLMNNEREGRIRFKQIWFSGNHSDIGGSYADNESRLSDVAFSWMVDEATTLPHPIDIDRNVLNLHPSSTGPQHDERRSFIDSLPSWLVRLGSKFIAPEKFGWAQGLRPIPHDAPLDPSVLERFKADQVLIYGEAVPYRPKNLREHDDTKKYF